LLRSPNHVDADRHGGASVGDAIVLGSSHDLVESSIKDAIKALEDL
jgi:hypothetical protein